MIPVDTAAANSALLENYVLVSGMDDFGWEPGEWGDDCEYCGGPGPPPLFNLPPPPRPPASLPDEYGVLQDLGALYADCESYQWTCPALYGAREADPVSSEQFPIAVIIVTAATLVAVILVAAMIVIKVKCGGRSSKSCTQLGGAIIYDDLPTVNNQARHHLHHQFKPITQSRDSPHGLTMGLHLYTPEPHSRPESEHLYQSISSGSETCSYSTGDAVPPSHCHRPSPLTHSYSETIMVPREALPSALNIYSEAQPQPTLLPHNELPFDPHNVLNTENTSDFTESFMSRRVGPDSPLCISPCQSPTHVNQMIQCHPMRNMSCQSPHPIVEVTQCHTMRHSPCHSPVHIPCHSPMHSGIQSPCSSTNYEAPYYFSIASGSVKSIKSPSSPGSSMYYVSGCNNRANSRPTTPQERGLPPLPSRSDRFRNYFSTDRNTRNAPGRPSAPNAPPRLKPDMVARRLQPDILGYSERNTNSITNKQNSPLSHNPLGLPPSYGADRSLPPSCDRVSVYSQQDNRNSVLSPSFVVENGRNSHRIEEEPLYENMP
ncbi:unnamed protein product [Meganyctiphanes norvegica]|uniref:Uncharacterized protein n=1 Tax=Meganyctiphanes norvegica TaxID=48144 RepID=A0AAV2PKN5_MEGNR